jgi:hypothetical protein
MRCCWMRAVWTSKSSHASPDESCIWSLIPVPICVQDLQFRSSLGAACTGQTDVNRGRNMTTTICNYFSARTTTVNRSQPPLPRYHPNEIAVMKIDESDLALLIEFAGRRMIMAFSKLSNHR